MSGAIVTRIAIKLKAATVQIVLFIRKTSENHCSWHILPQMKGLCRQQRARYEGYDAQSSSRDAIHCGNLGWNDSVDIRRWAPLDPARKSPIPRENEDGAMEAALVAFEHKNKIAAASARPPQCYVLSAKASCCCIGGAANCIAGYNQFHSAVFLASGGVIVRRYRQSVSEAPGAHRV